MATVFPILYKRASSGKIQQWKIWVEHDLLTSRICVEHGQVDGKLQRTETMITEGKNIGKANETTVRVQAESEALSKWKKQLDKDYTEEVEPERSVVSPMLAHNYGEYSHQINWDLPVFIQPKLDGVRCVAICDANGSVTLWSRQKKVFTTLDHIVQELSRLMQPNTIWDGELYSQDLDFQEIISAVKRRQDLTRQIKYHIYDVLDLTKSFYERWMGFLDYLTNDSVASQIYLQTTSIDLVYTKQIYSEEELQTEYTAFIDHGYEGAMVRFNHCPYQPGKRSRNLLKMKEFITEEFLVVGMELGVGKFSHIPTFIMKNNQEELFRGTPEGTEDIRREYWDQRESIIDKKLATVRFFSYTTSGSPVPRFPVVVGIRDYE